MSDSAGTLPDPLITASPDRMGGQPVFAGTRVPVKTLFDHLEAGDSIDVFLQDFPSVTREHALAVLRFSLSSAIEAQTRQQHAAE